MKYLNKWNIEKYEIQNELNIETYLISKWIKYLNVSNI